MKWIMTLVSLSFFFGAATVAGPLPLAGQEPNLEMQMARYVFSPGTIMKHQGRLDLTSDQEEAIWARALSFQDEVNEVQWNLAKQTEEWLAMLSRDNADADSLNDTFDGIVDMESRIKRQHMAMLLDIREILTLDQRKTLQEIMAETLPRAEGRGEGGGPRLP